MRDSLILPTNDKVLLQYPTVVIEVLSQTFIPISNPIEATPFGMGEIFIWRYEQANRGYEEPSNYHLNLARADFGSEPATLFGGGWIS